MTKQELTNLLEILGEEDVRNRWYIYMYYVLGIKDPEIGKIVKISKQGVGKERHKSMDRILDKFNNL